MAILCCVAKNSLRGTHPVNSSVLFRLLFRSVSRWVEAVLMLNMEACSCIHHQLGCSFWRAGHCHNGQGHPIHLCNVVLYMHTVGYPEVGSVACFCGPQYTIPQLCYRSAQNAITQCFQICQCAMRNAAIADTCATYNTVRKK
jgi:hypothetical protein